MRLSYEKGFEAGLLGREGGANPFVPLCGGFICSRPGCTHDEYHTWELGREAGKSRRLTLEKGSTGQNDHQQ